MLPWLPILGVIIALLLMISFGLSLFLCLYRGRKAQSHLQLPIDKLCKSENTTRQLKYTGPDGTCLPLSEGDLGNNSRVLNWLSTCYY